jgi:outer membrane protein TolC
MKSLLPTLLAAAALAGTLPVAGLRADPAPVPALTMPLTLAQAIAVVLARYPSLEAAQAEIDGAQARTTQSKADRLPQVSAQGGYTYNSLRPYIGFTFPGGAPTAFYESISNSYNASVTVRQLLTDFGRTDALVAAARAGELSARDALEEARHQLGYQTIQAFYGIVLLRQSVSVADEELQALAEARRIAERKFAAGSATKFDVLTTEVRQANARDRRTDTVASLARQETLLRQLLGLPPTAAVQVVGDFDPARSTLDLSTAIAEGIQHRPEMKRLRDDEEIAQRRLEAADRTRRPTLSAQATGGVDDGNLPNLYDNKGYLVAGVSMSVPLFTGERISGQRREARAGIRSAQARVRELTDQIGAEVQNALTDAAAAQARLANADTLVAQAEEALALAKTRYANGVITNFELLDAQSAARAAELTRLQARYDCVLASQAVSRAAGEAPHP